MPEPVLKPRAAVPFLQFDEIGSPFLQGVRCQNCRAVAPGKRSVCNACGARDAMEAIHLSERGRLYSFTIIHRSFPGVKVPFVAAIVELEGGGALKGTLLNVNPDPAVITYDMPLRIVYRDTGQVSTDGAPFVCYYFEPSESPE